MLCLPCADLSVICQCVRGLALAPKECAPSWRVHVFTLALVRKNSAFLLQSLFGTDELDQFSTEPCLLDSTLSVLISPMIVVVNHIFYIRVSKDVKGCNPLNPLAVISADFSRLMHQLQMPV